MDVNQIFQIINTGGVAGLLIVILVGGAKGWWIFGREYRALVADRDEWKSLALRGTSQTKRVLQSVEDAVA